MSEPSNKNEIVQFVHCGMCIQEIVLSTRERKKTPSPAEYANIEVGWTPLGIQVWCRRHGVNICHIDFEGVQHRANTTRCADRQVQNAINLLEDDIISVLLET